MPLLHGSHTQAKTAKIPKLTQLQSQVEMTLPTTQTFDNVSSQKENKAYELRNASHHSREIGFPKAISLIRRAVPGSTSDGRHSGAKYPSSEISRLSGLIGNSPVASHRKTTT